MEVTAEDEDVVVVIVSELGVVILLLVPFPDADTAGDE